MSSLEFIKQLSSGDVSTARDTLSDLLSTTAFNALEDKKKEIASSLFNKPVVEEETSSKPDIDVRSHYAKLYADNIKKHGMKNAKDKAYIGIEKKFGPKTVDQLKKWHDANSASFNEDIEINEESLTKGMKKIYDFGSGVHTAKVYHNREDNEYQVHYYKNGKHMGEGPVHYTDDKDDAKNTAYAGIKMFNDKLK